MDGLMPSVRIAASAIALHFVLSHSACAVTDEEYARRCSTAQALCRDGDAKCANWRDAFNAHGSVCPGVNALPGASMKGPRTPTSASVPAEPVARAIVDENKYAESAQRETLDDVRESCSARWGWHGLVDQTQCMKRVMARSNNPTDPYINLYILEADKLIDDVRHKRISETDAGVELQKAYLDMLARESAANESAARVAALQQQQEAERTHMAAEARAREQAAAEAAQRAQDQEAQRAVQQAALEQVKEQCREGMQINHNGINYAGLAQCDADPYAYARIKHINCSGNGINQISCTEQ